MLQTKTLPEPTANRQYYDSDGSYSHSSSGAFGVSSSFSEDILGKYALTSHPRDPDTGGYYTYAKSYEKTPHYEIAAVLKQEGTPTAYVRGNYKGDPLPSLVKGYNSTSFVVDGGTSVLPYNPIEKAVTATVESSSGAVSITPTKPITAPLVTGDTLTVGTG
jgi:hypothetical protein